MDPRTEALGQLIGQRDDRAQQGIEGDRLGDRKRLNPLKLEFQRALVFSRRRGRAGHVRVGGPGGPGVTRPEEVGEAFEGLVKIAPSLPATYCLVGGDRVEALPFDVELGQNAILAPGRRVVGNGVRGPDLAHQVEECLSEGRAAARRRHLGEEQRCQGMNLQERLLVQLCQRVAPLRDQGIPIHVVSPPWRTLVPNLSQLCPVHPCQPGDGPDNTAPRSDRQGGRTPPPPPSPARRGGGGERRTRFASPSPRVRPRGTRPSGSRATKALRVPLSAPGREEGVGSGREQSSSPEVKSR